MPVYFYIFIFIPTFSVFFIVIAILQASIIVQYIRLKFLEPNKQKMKNKKYWLFLICNDCHFDIVVSDSEVAQICNPALGPFYCKKELLSAYNLLGRGKELRFHEESRSELNIFLDKSFASCSQGLSFIGSLGVYADQVEYMKHEGSVKL